MDVKIEKKPNVSRNAVLVTIDRGNAYTPDQLGNVIKSLASQTNLVVAQIEKLHRALFGPWEQDVTGVHTFEHVDENSGIIASLADAINANFVKTLALDYNESTHTVVIDLYANDNTMLDSVFFNIPMASSTKDGLMSSVDKVKIDGMNITIDSKVSAHDISDVAHADIRQDITDLQNGTTVVKKAEQDQSGNVINTTYATKVENALKVDKTTTILGIPLDNNVLRDEFKIALGEATQSLSGLMSATDKSRLDALHALLGVESDANVVVDTINEVLAIFSAYPEGVDLVSALGGKVDKITPITWSALKNLRNNSLLKPGQQYRITDYTCTTVQANTQSAGHQFDIIVTADDVNKLNENARAVQHEGDTYFANSKLEAWKLMYCLDNDTDRFAWADDSANGKGVIYRMIDEFNNDCPYDFKNIQFLRSGVYYFTFTWITEDDTVWDASIHPELTNDEGQGSRVFGNIIPLANSFDGYILNDNVFIANYANDGGLFYGWYENIAKGYFVSNTFADSCNNNTFGNDCDSNTFGDGCYSNTFGNSCNNNTFGNNCSYNTFGSNCKYNTFGTVCSNNTFGTNCFHNTFITYCTFNTFGNNCQYLRIIDNTITQKKYISVDDGTQGASSANRFELYDSAILNKNYQVTFKKDADGRYVMTWLDDYEELEGKYKDNNLDTVWKALPHDIDGGTF